MTNATPRVGKMTLANWLSFAAVFLLALLMRMYRIGTETIWFDEAITYMGLHDFHIMDFYRNEAHHDPDSVPFYYTCAYLWFHLGFTSIFAMRMLSIVIDMAAVTGLFFFGRRLFGQIGGLGAALCMACAKLQVYEAQEIRNYAFTLALALLAMYSFYQAAVEGNRRWWPINVIANILLAYTHLLTLMLLFAQGVYLLATRPKKIHWIALWTGLHVPFLAAIPFWIKLITTANFEHETNWIPRSRLPRAIEAYYYVFAGSKLDAPDQIRTLPFGIPIQHILGSLILLGGLWFGVQAFLQWRRKSAALPGYRPADAAFLLTWLFVPPATLWMVGRFYQPCFLERYVLYSSLALYLCVGGALAALPRRSLQCAGLAVLALVYAGNSVDMQRPLRYDVGAAGTVLRDAYAPGEHVLSWHEDLQVPLHFYGGVPETQLKGSDDFAELAVKEAESGQRTWICFFEVPHVYEHEAVEKTITAHDDVVFKRWVYGGRWHMYLYEIDSRVARSADGLT